ncbi:alpha/beta-hydrolase [Anaeromyces robustus]|uniref:Alpha/beta-hydrolase n=1 Tax=Anaeromyces robustus TaxID=1754192 RepID=A0A1Y1X2D7_9FUNG|nr:alpha/beta-hydrolase [Anaeromyces robustus]|eukprot:ORX79494.1 alpha/beta-hydrolase [Anaeromyces robustus]
MKIIYLTHLIVLLLLILNINAKPLASSNEIIKRSDEDDLSNIVVDKLDQADFEFYKGYMNLKRNINYNKDRNLDVYYDKDNIKKLKPVVIFVYGGSWVTGNAIRYTKIGALLQKRGYVAVLPNYILYPNGTVDDMVEDIYNAIKWTSRNIKNYGGDPSNIILSGHSAGAHLSALTIIRATLRTKNNGIKLEPLPYIQKIVLLNGPYVLSGENIGHAITQSISNFFSGVKSTTTNYSDPKQITLLPKFIMKYYFNENIAPTKILKKLDNNSIFNHFNVGKFKFFYTSNDSAVPESSANNFMNELKRVSTNAKIIYDYRQGLEHATVLFGVKDGNPDYEDMFMDIIEKD